MKKFLITTFLTLCTLISTNSLSDVHAAENGKIAVLFSKSSESYANITRPGGSYNGTTVSKKVDFSSIYDKELKMYYLYKEQGFTVEKISETDLLYPDKLAEYDSIVFPYTVMMNAAQRQNVKSYIRDGGGAIFAFGTARNDSNWYPGEGKMDLSALIYHTKTWIFEWDNLSEVYQSNFVNDVVLKDYRIIPSNTAHPIIQNTLKELGKTSLSIENHAPGGDWIEVISPYNANAVPLLNYGSFSSSSSIQHTPPNTGAAYTISYGKGRVVFFGFKVFNHFGVESKADWEDTTKGLVYANTTGENDAEALLKYSLKWTMENPSKPAQRIYEVKMGFSELRAYKRAADYSVYGSVETVNTGNVPIRGTLVVEVINPNGTILSTYKRLFYGLSAGNTANSKHIEKFQLILPKSLPYGKYQIRTTFHEGKENTKGYGVKAEVQEMHVGNGPAIFKKGPSLKDVSINHGAYRDIQNLLNLQVIRGYPDGTFKPAQSVTRIQAAEMLLKSLNIPISKSTVLVAGDLKKGSYGYDIMATAVQKGLIRVENNRVRAFEPMKRGEMALALVEGFKLQARSDFLFKDVPVSNPASTSIQTLYALNVTTGFTDSTFRPGAQVTRAQFSSFITRSLVAVQN